MRGCSRSACEDVIRVRSLGEITRVFGVVHARADPRLDVHPLLPCVIAVRGAARASTATVRPQSSRLSTLGQTDHDGLPQPATRLLLLGALRGRPRLRPRPGPRLLTATYSK